MRVGPRDVVELVRGALDMKKYLRSVIPLIEEVRQGGDDAVDRLTRKFDGLGSGKVDAWALSGALDEEVRRAIDMALWSVKKFYSRVMPKHVEDEFEGVVRRIKWMAIEVVGIYVPRGYPSTLIMTGVPARVAGVRRIVVVTPPGSVGVDPATAYVALRLGAELYVANGVAGVAAMAFGTESIPKVDKIVGPGNMYVQVAKLAVLPYVGVDGIEGPTEIVVCAEDQAEVAALELAAQLEHSGAVGVLISTQEEVISRAEERLPDLTNARYFSVKVETLDEAASLVNSLAPEHVSLVGCRIEEKITNAGAISVSTPSALLDYVAGPSHVLPTGGAARWRGVLTPLDFMKAMAVVDGRRASEALLRAGYTIARHEGFEAHAKSLGEIYGL